MRSFQNAAEARSRSFARQEGSAAAILALPFVVIEVETPATPLPVEASPSTGSAARQVRPFRKGGIFNLRRLRMMLVSGRKTVAPQPNPTVVELKTVSRPLSPDGVMPAVAGHVERLDANGLVGWAFDPDRPADPTVVSLYIDDRLTAVVMANEVRPHLVDYGLGKGSCGFSAPLPKQAFYGGREAKVFVRIGGADVLLGRFDLCGMPSRNDGGLPVVHVDISDLVKFLARHRRVSGIQRFQVGIISGLMDAAHPKYDLEFCARRDEMRFARVSASELRRLLQGAHSASGDARTSWQALLERIRLVGEDEADIRPGDSFLTLGAPWSVENHSAALRSVRSRGARYFQVLYDIVPIAMPEVVDANFTPTFVESTATLVANADRIFSISDFSRSELETAVYRAGMTPPPCDVIRLGDTLTDKSSPLLALQTDVVSSRLKNTGINGEFVLCVGTIEPRKNLEFLHAVWKELLDKVDRSIPQLVLVGRIGWNIESFLQTLAEGDYLGRRIVHLQDVSDDMLAELYEQCLFTVFPSLYEGWGLPIIESFSHGKLCVCSSISAMPEAGRDLAVYINPRDVTGTVAVIDGLLSDRIALKEREDKVRREFAVTTWEMAAQDFSDTIATALAKPAAIAPPRLRNNIRYFVGYPDPHDSPPSQFNAYLGQARLNAVFDGTHWFELEADRRWACGPRAMLRIGTDSPANAVIIEMSVVASLIETPCFVHINGILLGSFVPMSGYVVLHVPLPDQDPEGVGILEVSTGTMEMPDRTDKRLLSFGVFSIMAYDQDRNAAFAHFLKAERFGRNRTMEDLGRNMIEMSRWGPLVR